jgi:uncharacterized protein (DUF488 family)
MNQTPIYTIGYGARDMATFVRVLHENEIAYLIDVRSKPYSRYKPEFSKQALQESLQEQHIRYVFMGDELGGQPADPSCYDADGKVDYEKCARREAYREGIRRLHEARAKGLRVALMCSEGKPESCHRSKLIGETLTAEGLPVMHIDEKDALVPHKDVLLRVIKGQPSLFGDDFFQFSSRKRYLERDDEAEGVDDAGASRQE